MELNFTRNYKDVVFIDLFERDKKSLLELFNFFNGTDYTDESEIDIVTIKDSLFVTKYNDLAFVFANVISLYEHQSTLNANLPLRLLCYLAEEYQVLANKNERSIYSEKAIQLPTPKLYIFYNGEKGAEDIKLLKLSDSFVNKKVIPDIDLLAHFVNINYGHNKDLMKKCSLLNEYAKFVDIIRSKKVKDENLEKHINETIDVCINEGILSSYLQERREFVLGSLIREFDQEKYDRTLKQDSFEEGVAQGMQQVLGQLLEEGTITMEYAVEHGYKQEAVAETK